MDFFFSRGKEMLVLGREMPHELCTQVFPFIVDGKPLVSACGRLAPGPRELCARHNFCLLAV